MSEQVRYRIDRALKIEAAKVCDEIGISPSAAVSLFFSQLIKLRALPFRPSQFPALEEYGASLAEIDAAEKSALKEIKAERKAGRVFQFKGKLA